jgi:tellurite resistance protein
MSNPNTASSSRPDLHRAAGILEIGRLRRRCGSEDRTNMLRWTRLLSARERIADTGPNIKATLARSETELLQALATASAFVALHGPDGPASRDEFMRFVDQQGFVPDSSPRVLGEAFDRAARQLKIARSALALLQDKLRPLAGLSLATVVVRTAGRVAAADGKMRPSRIQALIVLRAMLRETVDQKERTSWDRYPPAANCLA